MHAVALCRDIDRDCHFFFFQAEDGIRDLTVTGVQTCALPISRALPKEESRSAPLFSLEKERSWARAIIVACRRGIPRRMAKPTRFAGPAASEPIATKSWSPPSLLAGTAAD